MGKDLISRQDAIDAIHEDIDWLAAQGGRDLDLTECMERAKSILNNLPSVDEPHELDGCDYGLMGWQRMILENMAKDIPSAEPKKGKWTTEEVAEMLFNMFGEDCACNFNGIDEWLPERCKYAESTCPNPKEKHGCWMQFLLQGGADMRGEQGE